MWGLGLRGLPGLERLLEFPGFRGMGVRCSVQGLGSFWAFGGGRPSFYQVSAVSHGKLHLTCICVCVCPTSYFFCRS